MIDLVSIAETPNDVRILTSDVTEGAPNGRFVVAAAIRRELLSRPEINRWHVLSSNGWIDARTGQSCTGSDTGAAGVLFDPLRHYRDRLSLFRKMRSISWPVVTMAHSIGYGPWIARAQAERLWDAQPGDQVIFPSERPLAAWRELTAGLDTLSGRTSQRPQVTVLPYTLLSARLAEDPTPERATPADYIQFVTVGRLHPTEKFDFVSYAQACQRLATSTPTRHRVHVSLAGREVSAEVTEIIRQVFVRNAPDVSLSLLPDISEDEKWELLRGASAVVHPTNSHAESFGLVLDEAAALGVPIVVSRFSGQRSALANYDLLFEVPGSWTKRHGIDHQDALVQFGVMEPGRLDVDAFAEGLEWAAQSAPSQRSNPRASIRDLGDSLINIFLEAVDQRPTSPKARPVDVVAAFDHYWPLY